MEHSYAVQSYNAAGGSEWSESVSTMRVTPPETPANLAAVVDGNGFLISWDRPAAVHLNGYQVRIRTGDEPTGATEDMASDVTSHRMVAPIPNTLYRISVIARNAGGASEWSGEVEIILVLPPTAPRNVAAAPEGAGVRVTWMTPETGPIEGYLLEHGPAGSSTQKINLGADVAEYADTGGAPGETRRYRIRAHNSAGNGPWSEWVETAFLDLPGIPAGLAAAPEGGGILVTWDLPPADQNIELYRVRLQAAGDDGWREYDAGTNSSHRHENVTPGVTYRYAVMARNAAGDGEWSDPVEAVLVLAPEVPANLAAEPLGQTIQLTWDPVDGPTTRYTVRHGILGQAETKEAIVLHPDTEFIHADALGDTDYEYVVSASNSRGDSAWSEPVTGRWTILPHAPTSPAVAISGENLLLSWTAPTTGGVVDRYEVNHRPTGDGPWKDGAVATGTTSYEHTGPVPAQEYQYRVRSRNTGGPSSWSPVVTGIWLDGAAPPRLLKPIPTSALLMVRWNQSRADGVTGYEARFRSSDNEEWNHRTLGRVSNTRFTYAQKPEWIEYSVRTLTGEQTGDWHPLQRLDFTVPSEVRTVRAGLEGTNGVRVWWDEPESGTPKIYKAYSGGTFSKGVRSPEDSILLTGVTFSKGVRSPEDSILLTGVTVGQHKFTVIARADGIWGPAGEDSSHRVTIPEPVTYESNENRIFGLDIRMLSPDTARLTWKVPAQVREDIHIYLVKRETLSLDGLEVVSKAKNVGTAQPGNPLKLVDDGLEAGYTYRYQVTYSLTNAAGDRPGRLSAPVYATAWD